MENKKSKTNRNELWSFLSVLERCQIADYWPTKVESINSLKHQTVQEYWLIDCLID